MCGVNAYFAPLSPDDGNRLLRKMNSLVRHRGPDGCGIWTGRDVGLGHQRLAIIDIAGGQQPMHCCSGRYVISFNGEIYNFAELKAELIDRGYEFLTQSDTEVIPALIDAYGVNSALSRLRGMFAFVLYDTTTHSLLLARDFVGIKPLYVAKRKAGGWLICSEIKSAVGTGQIDMAANGESLLDFLRTGHTFAPKTAFRRVREIQPGTWMRIDASGVSEGRFWEWSFDQQPVSEAAALERIENCLSESVRAHLVSDVPVSCFVSGGVDSSLLAALTCAHMPAGIDTFNVSFDEQQYDEAPYARAVAQTLATRHHELKVRAGAGSVDILERVLLQYDQPFGDSSALPTFMVCEAVSKHCKVIISGDGGDEMFGGYTRYSLVDQLDALGRIPGIISVLRVLAKCLRYVNHARGRQLNKVARLARLPRAELIMSLLTYFDDSDIEAMVDADLLMHWRSSYIPPLSRSSEKLNTHSVAPHMIAFEIGQLLSADYLRKVDIASMAHGLEVRTPYLDRSVFDVAASIPVSMNVTRRSQKTLLKKVAASHLPKKVVYRPKQGFGIPLDRWLNNETMREFVLDLLASKSSLSRQFLSPRQIDALLTQLFEKAARYHLSRYQVYQRVFMLISLELWLRRWNPSLA